MEEVTVLIVAQHHFPGQVTQKPGESPHEGGLLKINSLGLPELLSDT